MSINNQRKILGIDDDGKTYPVRVSREWYERVMATGGVVGSIVQLTENKLGQVSGRLLPDEPIRSRILEEEKVNTIEFYAEVAKVQTTVDGVRVVLDLGEPGVKVMAALTECKQNGVVLDIEATPQEKNDSTNAKESQ